MVVFSGRAVVHFRLFRIMFYVDQKYDVSTAKPICVLRGTNTYLASLVAYFSVFGVVFLLTSFILTLRSRSRISMKRCQKCSTNKSPECRLFN